MPQVLLQHSALLGRSRTQRLRVRLRQVIEHINNPRHQIVLHVAPVQPCDGQLSLMEMCDHGLLTDILEMYGDRLRLAGRRLLYRELVG